MGRRAALISGLVAVAVFSVGIVSWREFAVRYQLYRMRRSHECLIRSIDRPEGSVAGQAVRRIFASKDFPGARLLQTYLEILTRARTDILDSRFPEVGFCIRSTGEFDFFAMSAQPASIRRRAFNARLEAAPAEISRLFAIHALLSEAHYRGSDFPDHPGAAFSFHPGGEAFPELSLMSGRKPPDEAYGLVQWPAKRRKSVEGAGSPPGDRR